MIPKKKKIIKENKTDGKKIDVHYINDQCPRKEKDCANCKILNCPEEH
jgi:hypothetical protein